MCKIVNGKIVIYDIQKKRLFQTEMPCSPEKDFTSPNSFVRLFYQEGKSILFSL